MTDTRDPWIRAAGPGALILLGLLVRLYNINAPFMDPIMNRSEDSTVIAQALYHLGDPSAADWQRRNAEANLGSLCIMEPRLLERLAALGYRVTGVCCWLPRLLSSLFWCLAAAALYRLVAEIWGRGAAYASTAFFLFMPYAIFSSRIFQPDPAMTALTVLATYALWREFGRPTWLTLIGSILATGAAMLVKIQCAMILGPTLVALAWWRHGFWGALGTGRVWALGIGACLPAVWYYGGGLFVSGTLQYQVGIQWNPSLYFQADYWLGWANCMATTAGIPALALSLAGLFYLPSRPARALVTGLWVGYILEGLFFTEAFDHAGYYHMPLLFIAAISLGAPLSRLIGGFCRARLGFRYALGATAAGLIVAAAWIGLGTAAAKHSLSPGIRGSIETALNLCGANTPSIRPWNRRDFEGTIQTAEEIGRKVNHSDRVILVGSDMARRVVYYGQIAVQCFPGMTGKLWLARQPREPIETILERFYSEPTPEYFLAWPADGLDAWPDLKRLLEQRYPVLERNDRYIIFDMRTTIEPAPGPE
jgi:hypothetical protein